METSSSCGGPCAATTPPLGGGWEGLFFHKFLLPANTLPADITAAFRHKNVDYSGTAIFSLVRHLLHIITVKEYKHEDKNG